MQQGTKGVKTQEKLFFLFDASLVPRRQPVLFEHLQCFFWMVSIENRYLNGFRKTHNEEFKILTAPSSPHPPALHVKVQNAQVHDRKPWTLAEQSANRVETALEP